MTDLSQEKQKALDAIENASNTKTLEELRVSLLGKSGSITGQLKSLGTLPPEERKAAGQAINDVKNDVATALEMRKSVLEHAEMEAQLKAEAIDVTLPARPLPQGKVHPITQVTEEIIAIFADMGFAVAEGPDIEDDFHNFTALNIPESHPARQMHDTFYLNESDGNTPVLRTHTSPVQIRVMNGGTPPFRAIAPGTTFRSDSDQTHTPMFHQVEGFVIDKDIHMGHLKGTVIRFVEEFFEVKDVPVRFRPSFFPFTEPSAEIDIGCKLTKNELVIGEGDDWMEIGGCGMVHPNVLKSCNIDSDEWQGFAFGMGIERLAMLKYGIPDLRTFFDGDVRWLDHYGFAPLHIPSLVGGL